MTARDVLVAELWREYRSLKQRDFGSAAIRALVDHVPHIPSPRIAALFTWLLANPPPGSPYRCKYCLHGTHSEDRECAACWAY